MFMRFLRENLLLLTLLLFAAAVFTIFVCPYLHDLKHGELCVVVYAIIALAFVYGRAMPLRRRPRKPGVQ